MAKGTTMVKGTTIGLAACYFAPKNFKLYRKNGFDSENPYAMLKKDILNFSSMGESFNGRLQCKDSK